MANQKHLDILNQGVEVWNQWRKEHPEIQPDLRDARLIGADLTGAIFGKTDLRGAILSRAYLDKAILSRAYLSNADLNRANLVEARLIGVDLTGAFLYRADLRRANLSGAYLSWSNLTEADLSEANLTGCSIYAISAWNVQLKDTIQSDLIITRKDEPTITVENLKVAQFIYLLLNNKEIRDVIDTITSKVVLILGRFIPERKIILDAIREELRKRNYTPVLFDFEKPASRDITETISTLAHIARFIIADLTDAKSIPQELQTIVPNLPSVPIQPLLLDSQREYGMFEHFTRFPWVLPIYHYADEDSLLQSLKENIIEPAERKAKELAQR